MNIYDLDKKDLMFFIDCYNQYVTSYYGEHDIGSQPVGAYEFYDNEFQEIFELREKTLKEIEEYVQNAIVPNNMYETYHELEMCYSDLAENINEFCYSSANVTIMRYLDNLEFADKAEDVEPEISTTDLDNGINDIMEDYDLTLKDEEEAEEDL